MPDNIFTLVCEKCKGGHHEEQIVLCDRCDKGWHMFCLTPALDRVPAGSWVCPTCRAAGARGGARASAGHWEAGRAGEAPAVLPQRWPTLSPLVLALSAHQFWPSQSLNDGSLYLSPSVDYDAYSFKEGEDQTLEEFERKALAFERHWFGSEAAAREVGMCVSARACAHLVDMFSAFGGVELGPGHACYAYPGWPLS